METLGSILDVLYTDKMTVFTGENNSLFDMEWIGIK